MIFLLFESWVCMGVCEEGVGEFTASMAWVASLKRHEKSMRTLNDREDLRRGRKKYLEG